MLAARLSARNRASYGAGLADALLRQGARQDAVAAAAEVLPVLEGGVTSMRCLNRLRIVRQAAADSAGTQEFCERFDAVERTLTASYGLPCEDMPDARADIPALRGRKSPRNVAGKPTVTELPQTAGSDEQVSRHGMRRETRFVTGLTPACRFPAHFSS